MKARSLTAVALAGAAFAAPAGAATGAVGHIKARYRSVMLAEYFGPASKVCSQLTAKGKRAYELEASTKTCRAAFKAIRYGLHHKTKGVDNSGYTPSQWRNAVNFYVTHLTVRFHGGTATAIGPSGIPGETTLIRVNGAWIFDSAPPSPQS